MTIAATADSFWTDSTFAGAVLAAIITAVFAVVIAYIQYRNQIKERKKAVTAALFAELAHIDRHYRYSAYEISQSAPPHPVIRRLAWSKYGVMAANSNLKDNAILGAQQMAEVLQLSLVIRNTDLYLDELLSNSMAPTQDELNLLVARMESVAVHANALVRYILAKDHSFEPITLT
jgi:Tfp pilus assembly protein PilE